MEREAIPKNASSRVMRAAGWSPHLGEWNDKLKAMWPPRDALENEHKPCGETRAVL